MNKEQRLWNYDLDEIIAGYKEDKENYICTVCGCEFAKGRIYKTNNQLYDSYGAVCEHVKTQHGMLVDYLLKQNLNLTGISEVQQQILILMAEGKGDKEIASIMDIAQSTVRNHRFKLREKEKQAKLFLALMRSLEKKVNSNISMTDSGEIKELHQSATMVDDRYSITEQERTKTIQTYMNQDGSIKQFPAREKKKIIILTEIMKRFESGMGYPEKEINTILAGIYDDYATIRRALIEYGFMERSSDCKLYRVKE